MINGIVKIFCRSEKVAITMIREPAARYYFMVSTFSMQNEWRINDHIDYLMSSHAQKEVFKSSKSL